jgi:hypothetical protein
MSKVTVAGLIVIFLCVANVLCSKRNIRKNIHQELRISRRVSSSCFLQDTHRVTSCPVKVLAVKSYVKHFARHCLFSSLFTTRFLCCVLTVCPLSQKCIFVRKTHTDSPTKVSQTDIYIWYVFGLISWTPGWFFIKFMGKMKFWSVLDLKIHGKHEVLVRS